MENEIDTFVTSKFDHSPAVRLKNPREGYAFFMNEDGDVWEDKIEDWPPTTEKFW